MGIGIIIRDFNGDVMASSALAVQASFSVPIVEALAIKKDLQFAPRRVFPCIVESDAQVVVNLILSAKIPCSEVGLLILDIKRLLQEIPNSGVVFAHRSSNMAAHELTKLGKSTKADMFD
ncbi:hypothetical protein QYF36_003834 [Acer negundo]|nr:hypothetical protein QYF36_003834 [Acer negundo]